MGTDTWQRVWRKEKKHAHQRQYSDAASLAQALCSAMSGELAGGREGEMEGGKEEEPTGG